jgi:4-diphosphocytidyl-2-C-methyl-D-erythritol kinase
VRPLIIPAPAKINLFLHITGKREDGYSLLQSLVAFTEYGDEIQVAENSELSLEIAGEFGHELATYDVKDNLVIKAAIALQEYINKPLGAKIKLVKNLPIASGIGGGSSDAAATLRALCELWRIAISDGELLEIAIKLGSDVPVCLSGNTALMSGIGEEVKEVDLQGKTYIVLVNPNIHLSTAEMFGDFWKNPSLTAKNFELNEFSIQELANEKYSNSLQPIAISRLPIIGEIINELRTSENCVAARMSGSGATCFGLYYDKISAENARKKLQRLYPQSWCIDTKIK